MNTYYISYMDVVLFILPITYITYVMRKIYKI